MEVVSALPIDTLPPCGFILISYLFPLDDLCLFCNHTTLSEELLPITSSLPAAAAENPATAAAAEVADGAEDSPATSSL